VVERHEVAVGEHPLELVPDLAARARDEDAHAR
jgi:hypothetical protein